MRLACRLVGRTAPVGSEGRVDRGRDHTDCKFVWRKWHDDVRAPQAHADLWARFWLLIDSRPATAQVQILWGRSHLGEQGVLDGICSREHTAANDAADRLAGERAAQIQASAAVVRRVQETDELVRSVQLRLAAIVRWRAADDPRDAAALLGQQALKQAAHMSRLRAAWFQSSHSFRVCCNAPCFAIRRLS